MDTMNNVLGILILALILTRLIFPQVENAQGISKESIARLRAQLSALGPPDAPPPVDPTDREWRLAELETLQDHLAQASKERDELLKTGEMLERERAELNKQLSELPPETVNVTRADLERSISDIEKAIAALRDSIRQATAALKALTRSAPVKADKVVDVSVPSTEGGVAVESAPRDAEVILFACTKGRVLTVDTKALDKAIGAAIKALFESKGKSLTVLDLKSYFETNDVGDPLIRVEMIPIRDREGPTCLARLIPRPSAGEEIETIRSGRSAFEKRLRELNVPKVCVVFKVWSDSFESYLAARKLADSLGLSCGWQPFAMDEYTQFKMFRATEGDIRPEIDVRRN
jgi:hypothetical protein